MKKKNKGIRIFLRIQIILILIVLFGIAFYFLSGLGDKVEGLRSEAVKLAKSSNDASFRAVQTGIIYDKNDQVISTIVGERESYYLTYDQIPVFIKKAFVAVEDRKFFSHNGIDFRAILRAILAYFQNGYATQGASTITQQLARNMYLSYEKTWERKVEEIFLALELEKMYSKEKILEYYINNIYYANGYYGIQAASRGYFNKDVSELSLSEMIFLVAIPNNPTTYDPITNYNNTIENRNQILKSMLEQEIINQNQYEEAVDYKIKLDKNRLEMKNYVETYAHDCATRALMEWSGFKFQYEFASTEARMSYEKEFDRAYSECVSLLYSKGYRIYTSIDLEKQNKLQAQIDNTLAAYKTVNKEGVYELQGAAVCINNITGYVEAVVGGRNQDMSFYTLNRAYQSYRQPGSTIKPILVYTPMIERGYNADSKVVDEKIENGPQNADLAYAGEMTLRNAVAYSKNTIAWKLFDELTPQKGLEYLFKMNFSNIRQSDYCLPASLGGLTYGVSVVEMAGAYECLANDGKFIEPTCITKITDANGNIVWERRDEKLQVYKSEAAREMTDMLTSVLKYGTGRDYSLSSMDSAGKTGTTDDDKDRWFVGYTHYYTTSIWIGYDIPKSIPSELNHATIDMWKSYMEDIHRGLKTVNFSKPLYKEEEQSKTDPSH